MSDHREHRGQAIIAASNIVGGKLASGKVSVENDLDLADRIKLVADYLLDWIEEK